MLRNSVLGTSLLLLLTGASIGGCSGESDSVSLGQARNAVTGACSAGITTRISVSSSGAQANGASAGPRISADGLSVAYSSSATNLIANDTNGVADVFVYNRSTRQTERVSVSSSGAQANGDSGSASLSADGRYVAFSSVASNLVSGDTNNQTDIFVRDRVSGQTTRVSVSSSGAQTDSLSTGPVISADGRYVTFMSFATTLVPNTSSGGIFVHDRQTGQTSVIQNGGFQFPSSQNSISNDGRYIAFFVPHGPGVPGGFVRLHDRVTGVTEVVNVKDDGSYPNIPFFNVNGSAVYGMSGNGRFATLNTVAPMDDDDTNSLRDVYVRDRTLSQTLRASVASDGTQANAESFSSAVSNSGNVVTFASSATNLVANDANAQVDIFLHDGASGETRLVSVSTSGIQGNGRSEFSAPSADGQVIAFESVASNLVTGDSNAAQDVFIREFGICCPAGTNIIQGTAAGDTLVGTEGADCILAAGGDDTIDARGGNDIVFGGPGNDSIVGGYGDDQIQGEDGADTIDSGPGNDQTFGGSGTDNIAAALGSDIIDGGDGSDACTWSTDGTDSVVSCER